MTERQPAAPSPSARQALDRAVDESLAAAGLRRTPVRALVLEALHRTPSEGQDRRDIALWVLAQPDAPSSSTVYSAILDLERHGLLGRTWTSEGQSVYWLQHGVDRRGAKARMHMVCRHCARRFPVDDAGLFAQLQRWGAAHGLRVTGSPAQPLAVPVACVDCTPPRTPPSP